MRLVTRSDFDGLICGMLLMEADIIDSWIFVHPKDLQDGLFEANENDVLANVPYVSGCGMWFDHHLTEADRVGWTQNVKGESRLAPSAARIIYEYLGGEKKFDHYQNMITAVDKVDSGNLNHDEILNPTGWVLLGFLSDPRTGLGRFRNFHISNYQLMEELITHCRNLPIDDILKLPDIQERIDTYNEQTKLFHEMIEKYTKLDGNVIITDLRGVEQIWTGNRFYIYSMYPEQNVSVWIIDGKLKQNISIACGYSVLNRTCDIDIGKLMLGHGGGGHKMVGTCQVPYDTVDEIITDILSILKG